MPVGPLKTIELVCASLDALAISLSISMSETEESVEIWPFARKLKSSRESTCSIHWRESLSCCSG